MNLKILFTIWIYLMTMTFGICQSFQPFNQIDFKEGGYRLVGKFTTLRNDAFSSNVRSFYIDDISTLEKIQKTWKFKKPGNYFACGYDYNLLLTKNGKTISAFSINLECNEIAFGPTFYFKPNLLTDFRKKMNYLSVQEIEVTNKQKMKQACDSLINSEKLIFIDLPKWYLYEGSFQYEIEQKIEGDLHQQIMTEYNLENEIKEKVHLLFPNEPIEIYISTGEKNLIIEVFSSKKVFDYFASVKNVSYFKQVEVDLERISFSTLK